MILTIAICLLLFFLFIYTHLDMGFYSLLYATALLVAPMSHLWHVMYGEGRIKCNEAEDRAFGWTPCWTGAWEEWTNSYEVTLPVEFLFLAALVFYVTEKPAAWLLNGIHIVLILILLFASPILLDTYASIFDISGLIVTTVLLFVIL